MNDGTDRIGEWMQTFTGRRFWPLDPRPEEIRIEDVAHSLALNCRFNGHCRVFYSVAQHSVLVARLLAARQASVDVQLFGLLHDGGEAYVADVPRPLKSRLDGYHGFEDRVLEAVYLGLIGSLPTEEEARLVRLADDCMLATEARDLMGGAHAWGLVEPPQDERVEAWDWSTAETTFLELYEELKARL